MIPKEPGGLLSHYRLVEKIGEGGMGVVWKAVDTVLGRSVAIKFLPEALAQHPERRARLEREAKLLASLNHPNIASIYGLEEADGVLFLVMEFVPGETLEQLLEKGSLTGEEPLYFSRQIAGALETAHDRGVIHRDLKPANVKVTPEGMVKVLDFGLAKAFETEAGSGDISRSPTITTGGTRDGVILGTAAYMSPEQARGKPVDRRTDIWSFGCVLFEMITGARPFQGETFSDTIAAILKQEPDWSSVPINTSAEIESLVRKCLRKDSYQRLQHIGDARVEIDDLLEGRSATRPIPAAVSSVPPRRYPLWGLGLAAMVLVLLGALLGRLIFPTSGIPPERDPKVSHLARLTHDTGLSEGPTWSPDGSLLAFASNRSGNFEVYVRRVEGGQDINITNDPGQDFQPAFSPDGDRVAFISTRSSRSRMIKIAGLGLEFRTFGGDLWVAPALGGQARRLARDANFPAWDPGGRKIIYVSGPEYHRSILEVSADGSGTRTILSSDGSNWEIVRLRYSPGGKWISVEDSFDGEIFLIPSSGGEPRKLVEGSSHEWDPSGRYLYFLKREKLGGTRLHSVRVSELSGKVVENPNTVTLMTGLLRDLAISRDGKSLAVSELNGSRNLTLLPLDEEGKAPGGPEEILNRGQIIDTIPAFSPDGRRISFNSNRLGVNDLWILDLDTGRQKRLELPGDYQDTGWSFWFPDGEQMAVTMNHHDGTQSIWLVAVDGSTAEEIVPPFQGLEGGPIAPDGSSLLYAAQTDGFFQIFVFDLTTREPRQLTSTSGDKRIMFWSPDGKWVNYSSNASGTVQIWKIPSAGGKERQVTSGEERNIHAFYSPDGKWLYVQPSHRNIFRMPAAGGELLPVTHFPESGLFIEEPTLSPDGRYLAYCRSHSSSSLWILSLEPGGSLSP